MSRKLADRRQRRRHKLAFLGIVATLVAYGALVGDHRPHHLLMLYLEEERTAERIDELEQHRAELTLTRDRLERDAFALESLAREKGLARPDEIVYRIVPVPPAVHRATGESLAAVLARQRADSARAAEGSGATEGPRTAEGLRSADGPRPAEDPWTTEGPAAMESIENPQR